MGSVASDSSSVVAEGAPALAAAGEGEGSAAAAGAGAGAAGGSASVQCGGVKTGGEKKFPFQAGKNCKCGICIVDFLLKNVLFVVCNPEISLEEEFLI